MLKQIVLAVSSLCAMLALGDVHSDAHFWLRNMGRDANGNGEYDSGELCDSNLNQPLSDMKDNSSGSQQLQWKTEDVLFPSRYVTRKVRTLYFAQTLTGEEATTFYPSTVTLQMPAADAVGEHYTVHVRARPDATQLNGSLKWLVNYGNTWEKNGLLIGYMPANSQIVLACPARNNIVAYLPSDAWSDIIVSVDGKTVTWLVQRAPSSSTKKTWMVSGTIITAETATTQPNGKNFRLGGEVATTGQKVQGTSETYFRGSIQDCAVWTRSLTLDEMKEAISAPRLDLMRVGVENNSTADFFEPETLDEVDADGDWILPHDWAASQSLSIGFPLETAGQRRYAQALRIKTTTSSATCSVRAVFNEVDLGTVTVSPGDEGWWLVPPTALAADNTLVLTRTDVGNAAAHLDVIGLGGSIQLGENTNNAEDDFCGTDTPVRPYPLVSGHARAFPYTLSKATVPTASLLIDEPHAQLRNAYHYFGVRAASEKLPQTIQMTFNGKVYEAKSVPHSGWVDYSWKIDPSEIKAKGNEVVLSSSEDGAVWFDSVSWSFEKFRKGMILIFR